MHVIKKKNTTHMGKDYNNNLIKYFFLSFFFFIGKYFLYLNIQASGEKLWLKMIKNTHRYISGWEILISFSL